MPLPSFIAFQPRQGWLRVKESWVFALQASIAAGMALFIASDMLGHERPFFAPIAAVISLGVHGGARLRRSFELVLGSSLGVGIGDLFISQVGSGLWQVSVVVFIAIILAVFADRGPMVPIQSASSAVLIATLIPPGSTGSFDRMGDALIGGCVGIAVIAIFPNSPLRAARREVAGLIRRAASVLEEVSAGIALEEPNRIRKALEKARGTQTSVNAMLAEVTGGNEVVALSPMYWTARRHTRSMMRILVPVDNVMRDSRVLARRAEIMVRDGEKPKKEMEQFIAEIAQELDKLGRLWERGGTRGDRRDAYDLPEIVREFRVLGGRAGLDIAEGTGLSGMVVLAQCRSIIVDALQVCGLSQESAMAVLRPTVDKPALPPEVWNESGPELPADDVDDIDVDDR